MTLHEEKAELRKRIKTVLEALGPEEAAERSLRASKNLLALPEYQRAEIVVAFLSMGKEIQTEWLLRSAQAEGKLVVVPRMEYSAEAGHYIVFVPLARDYPSWPRDRFGIPEPPVDSPALAWEEFASHGALVVTPGLAFDKMGGRLGRGMGYYDRFLSRAREVVKLASPPESAAGSGYPGPAPLVACGFCYSIQLVEAAPKGAGDELVDLVATDEGAFHCGAA